MPKRAAGAPRSTLKARATQQKILDSALHLFQTKGFDATTTREIATKAGVAPSAAYYYFPSKDTMVLSYYRQTFHEMMPRVEALLASPGTVEEKMRDLIRIKFEFFKSGRGMLRAIVRNGANPKHPVSPFGRQARPLRTMEIGWFRAILESERLHAPRALEERIPEVLWLLHMGVMFFWIVDDSPRQRATMRLLDQGMKTVTALLRQSPLAPAMLEAS